MLQKITNNFKLLKFKQDLKKVKLSENYDLVYFDAFSPKVQPDLWTEEIFRNIANHMNKNAILTTYSAKGIVRRTLEKCGLIVERIPGPPGKREILRAIKP